MRYYIGIDFGGMSVKAGIFNEKGDLLFKDSSATSKAEGYHATVKKTAALMRALCQKAGAKEGELAAAGMGTPGVIDGEKGIVVRWTNYDWTDLPFAADLSAAAGVPVRISNDANVAALGEAAFGAGKQYKDSILITLGTGIGSGIILGGKIFEGFCGGGAEAGHMVIVAGGILCPCGRRGCFEQYASATALVRDTKRAMFEAKDSLMWEIAGQDAARVDGRTAFTAAEAGDAAAEKVVKNYVMYLSEGILNLVSIFRPQAIIVGGGVSGQGENLLRPVRRYVGEHLYVDSERIPLSIVRAQLGNDAGIWGAYALARGTKE